jgi:hypothetical protein
MATIFSGMQLTGELHLGNYLGALRQRLALVRSGQHDAIFCDVDASDPEVCNIYTMLTAVSGKRQPAR